MLPLVSPAPTVVTIHDMSLRLYPRYHPPRRVLLNRPLVDLAARRADAIITPSESAKRDIVRFYDLDPRRVHVVYEAAAPSFRRVADPVELERVRRRYHLNDRIILYVGTIEPRKNLPKLIDAFAAQRRAGRLTHQLVCVGPYGWLSRGIEDQIARANVAHAINFTGYVPFEDLPALYTLAEFFVYPSMYEGFGLPVIEAMACGAPVIAYDCGSAPEVIEEGLTGFIVRGEDEAVAAVGRIATLDRLAIRRRFEERFTATAMARRYLELYGRQATPTEANMGLAAE
jgi:glycosyltransferase involved in cell wall biosynthesis